MTAKLTETGIVSDGIVAN